MNSYDKQMTHEEFRRGIDLLCKNLSHYILENNIKIDYICPILRSGAVPAVYIANQLNIVKFAPIQIKHITYREGTNKIEMIFNPFLSLKIGKEEPVFLVVEAMQSTGTSVKICLDEIKNRYPNAKILYVCFAKQYNSTSFKDETIYEDMVLYYNGNHHFSEEKCQQLGISYLCPLFPWENLKMELKHPDDLEENIFF